jgi:uncharacterized protein YerC
LVRAGSYFKSLVIGIPSSFIVHGLASGLQHRTSLHQLFYYVEDLIAGKNDHIESLNHRLEWHCKILRKRHPYTRLATNSVISGSNCSDELSTSDACSPEFRLTCAVETHRLVALLQVYKTFDTLAFPNETSSGASSRPTSSGHDFLGFI